MAEDGLDLKSVGEIIPSLYYDLIARVDEVCSGPATKRISSVTTGDNMASTNSLPVRVAATADEGR